MRDICAGVKVLRSQPADFASIGKISVENALLELRPELLGPRGQLRVRLRDAASEALAAASAAARAIASRSAAVLRLPLGRFFAGCSLGGGSSIAAHPARLNLPIPLDPLAPAALRLVARLSLIGGSIEDWLPTWWAASLSHCLPFRRT